MERLIKINRILGGKVLHLPQIEIRAVEQLLKKAYRFVMRKPYEVYNFIELERYN